MIINYNGSTYTSFEQLVGLEIILSKCNDIYAFKTNDIESVYQAFSYCVTVDNIVIVYYPHNQGELPNFDFDYTPLKGKIKINTLSESHISKLATPNTIERVVYSEKLVNYVNQRLISEGYVTTIDDTSIIATKNNETYRWYLNNPTKLYFKFRVKDFKISKQILQKHTKREVTRYKPQLIDSFNDRWLYNKQFVFEEGVTLFRSHMGSGKTQVIKQFLEFSKKTLVVTPRINLTKQHIKNLDVDCVTYNSLFKIDVNQYESVVFDEFETLIEHITMFKITFDNFSVFKQLCDLKNIIVFDACLSTVSVDFFSYKENVRFISNSFRQDVLCVIHTSNSIIDKMLNERSRRFTVSVSTIKQMNKLHKELTKRGKRCVQIDSEVDDVLRARLISQFENGEFDVLLFTSCLGVGVSILCKSDTHYHIDSVSLLSSTQTTQMTNRVRGVKTIHIYTPNKRVEMVPNKHQVVCEYCNTPFIDYETQSLTPMGELFYRVIKYSTTLKHKSYLEYAISVNYNECLIL